MMQMTFDRFYGSFMSSMLHLLVTRTSNTHTHPSPISFADYNAKCPAAEKFRRALGIATIANFYGSSSITKWAVAELLARLFTCCTAELLPRLHRLATACSDVSPKFHAAVRQQWCTMIGTTTDPVATLCAAKEIDDTYLQAYAYFHVLQKTNGEISKDARLTPLDRMRLLVGSMNLRRYDDMDCPCTDLGTYHRSSGGESLGDAEITGGSWNTVGRGNLGGRWHPGGRGSPGGRGHMGARDHPGDRKHKLPRPQATTDAQLWSPKTSAPLQDSYEQHSLWDMFTVSPVGLVLHDGVELSQPSIPQ